MRKLVETVEVNGEGLISLMGHRVTLFCQIYIYTGKLIGVNDKFVLLEDAAIVYETDPLCDNVWKDAQKLPHDQYVMIHSIESFGILK